MTAEKSQPDAPKCGGIKSRGRHQTNRLSAVAVKTANPGRHFDGHGLFLLVEKNGARRWGQRLTIQGRRREMGLGSPPVVTLARARESALRVGEARWLVE
ncbi:Arm DNA-binding domain-containing protein [Aliiroseovarius subalbicans]|uniref:Arm DNA-binding domain-containing protein n=1 Tax=Aliiroseovarius subalbicans TaxID=2925840 RepID=UPI001F58522F|nr:Arm DNA-binding domain-containing protein [Aliiroseovarius subalbicans]MCI2399368.1 Arm DNA-binding domain-containing protein [Aliiroseovarius subalbicans]